MTNAHKSELVCEQKQTYINRNENEEKKKVVKKKTKRSIKTASRGNGGLNSDISEHLLLTDSKSMQQHAILSFSVAN